MWKTEKEKCVRDNLRFLDEPGYAISEIRSAGRGSCLETGSSLNLIMVSDIQEAKLFWLNRLVKY